MPSRRPWPCSSRRDCSASTPTCRRPFRPTSRRRSPCGGPPPAGLSADEKHAWDQLDFFYKNGLGYAIEMNNRPQTLYGMVDSPVGLAAWMLDHDARSYRDDRPRLRRKDRGPDADDVLDNVTLYWLTNTAISSARLYWDNAQLANGRLLRRPGASRSRSPSAPSPTRSTRRRRAGRRRPIPSSSTTTSSPRAATSPPGSSRRSSSPRCAPHSSRCGSRDLRRKARGLVAALAGFDRDGRSMNRRLEQADRDPSADSPGTALAVVLARHIRSSRR